ncbi:MAG: hypothetical protein IK095_02725, partial [Oscillospiraceae bacterium]|nr:hypothetical protein [Oscillospiraceae bacterium]
MKKTLLLALAALAFAFLLPALSSAVDLPAPPLSRAFARTVSLRGDRDSATPAPDRAWDAEGVPRGGAGSVGGAATTAGASDGAAGGAPGGTDIDDAAGASTSVSDAAALSPAAAQSPG